MVRYVFLSLDKNACSIFAYLPVESESLCRSNRSLRFSVRSFGCALFYFQEDRKMKKILALVLAFVMMLSVCGCGKAQTEENDVSNGDDLEKTVNTSQGPSGKYYYELLDSIYYEFDGEDNCYLVSESNNAKTSYLYVFDKNATYEGAEGIFVIHISDINSGGSHKVVYDSIEDTIWDPDFGIFEKK